MIIEIHVTGDELNALNQKVGSIHMPKTMTNEEWFCRLSTKEKAKFLEAQQKHGGTIASRSDVDWEVWLKEKHE